MRTRVQKSNEEDKWKYTVSKYGLGTSSLILFIRFITDLTILGPSAFANYITLFASFLYGSLFIYLKYKKKYQTPIFLGVLMALVIMIVRAELTGGLTSPVMSWFSILPIISSFVLTKKKTYFVTLLSIASIFLIYTNVMSEYIQPYASELPSFSKFIMYTSIIFLSTFICLIHEDKRLKMYEKIEEQKMEIITSTRQAELGEVAAGIAHEVNNPLTVLKVKARKILFHSKDNPDLSHIIDSANKILLMTERISKIIKSMKSLSKGNGESDEFSMEKVNTILDNVTTLCESKIKYSNTILKINKAPNKDSETLLPAQVGHVLLSLVNNSCDAISKSQQKWIEISTYLIDEKVIFTITDSGKGISLEEQERIFNPFFSKKENGLGTGLGLSISRSVIESFGGTLEIDSNSPNTSFKIILPIKQENAKHKSKEVA